MEDIISISLVLLGLVVGTIAIVSWNRVRTAPATRRDASTDGDFSAELFDGGVAGSADGGDGAVADGGD